eukprot:850035-Pleurochrysis_carterae.AAC.5
MEEATMSSGTLHGILCCLQDAPALAVGLRVDEDDVALDDDRVVRRDGRHLGAALVGQRVEDDVRWEGDGRVEHTRRVRRAADLRRNSGQRSESCHMGNRRRIRRGHPDLPSSEGKDARRESRSLE